MPLWLAVYMGDLALPSPLPASLWHGHEMLFGYGAAVLAGFLLTATPELERTAAGQAAPRWRRSP